MTIEKIIENVLNENDAGKASATIFKVLNKKFPNKISINHQDNLLTITFEIRQGTGSKFAGGMISPSEEKPIRELAVKLANTLQKELEKFASLEETDLSFDANDPNVTFFLVSDSFIGMNRIVISKKI